MLPIILSVIAVVIVWLASKHWPLSAKSGSKLFGTETRLIVSTGVVTVGTYNIHRGRGLDGTRNLARIAEVISRCDVVALQEVEGHGLRHFGNQAYKLSQTCGYKAHFSPTRRQLFFPHRGNAILTRLPVMGWQREPLSPTTGKAYRNVTTYDIDINGTIIHILNTHLSRPSEQMFPLKRVIDLFLSYDRAVLVGDFNAYRTEPELQRLLVLGAEDATVLCGSNPDQIDWILVRGLEVLGALTEPPGASDHPFFSATLRLR